MCTGRWQTVTDDIVTRLRHKYAGQLPICAEAADEIERLRTELALTELVRQSEDLGLYDWQNRDSNCEEGHHG